MEQKFSETVSLTLITRKDELDKSKNSVKAAPMAQQSNCAISIIVYY